MKKDICSAEMAEAVERVYDLLVQPIAGPMPAGGQL